MSPVRRTCLLVLSTIVASCSPPDVGSGTTFSDSAGVTLAVAEAPSWLPGEGWMVAEEPTLQIGALEGPEEYQFTQVVGAVRQSNGQVLVADRGTSEIKVFSPDGVFLRRFGRPGEGPGEFRRLAFVGVMQGDSLATFDSSLRRVQVFDPEGGHARTFLVESMVETAMPDKVIDIVDGVEMAIRYIDFGDEIPNGIARWPRELVVTMDLRSGRLDSIKDVPGSEAYVEARPNGGYSHGRYVFGKGNEFSAEAGRIAIISTEEFAVEVLGSDGSPGLIIRRAMEKEPTTPEHQKRYADGVIGILFPADGDSSPEDAENYRRSLLNTPTSPTVPLLRSVKLDAEGNVWVESYFHPGEDPPPYQVFRADGTWLGEVAFPPGFDRGFIPYQAPSFQIGADFVLGVWKDELDVQYVRLYELNKG
jgi:hypothetical protein